MVLLAPCLHMLPNAREGLKNQEVRGEGRGVDRGRDVEGARRERGGRGGEIIWSMY